MTFSSCRSELLFHLADTFENLSEIPGKFFKKLSYDKDRVKKFCELVCPRKLLKARELPFLRGLLRGGRMSAEMSLVWVTHARIFRRGTLRHQKQVSFG